MQKRFESVDEVLAEEVFLAWFFKTNPEQEKAMNEWLKQYPDQKPLVDQAVAIMNELSIGEKEIPAPKIHSAYEKLMSSIDEAGTPVFEIRRSAKRWWVAAAAAAVIIIAGSFLIWNNISKTESVVLATGFGQLNENTLPDGSQVMLNASSTVTLSKDFDKGNDREVWLKGEAFFHVAKTPSKNRFIVHTDRFDIVVTGTKFNAVNRDDKISVLLTEGSITVITKDGEELKLVPGDYVEMKNDKLEKRETSQDAVLAWKDRRIDFDNVTMREAAKIISEHYGVKVVLANDEIAEKRLTGIMPNDNLDVLIRALEVAYEYKITKNNNEIIIAGNGK